MCLVLVKIYGKRPIKLEKIINMKKEINTKIVPGLANPEKTANSSSSTYSIKFSKVFDIWDPRTQYTWGSKKIITAQEIQFKGKEIDLNLTIGSKDENKLDIKVNKDIH